MSRNPYDDDDAARFATSDSVDKLAACLLIPSKDDSSDETVNVVDALDAATRSTGGVGLLVDTFPDDTRAAILRAVQRRVSNREIAKILTANGYACSEGAVRVWVQRNG